MGYLIRSTATVVMGILLWASIATAQTTDTYIKQLKDKDAEVRAKAAQELGAG